MNDNSSLDGVGILIVVLPAVAILIIILVIVLFVFMRHTSRVDKYLVNIDHQNMSIRSSDVESNSQPQAAQ